MRNQVLDASKAIAAYFVVLLHIRFPGMAGELVNAFARYAVPFFFLISGYFCFYAKKEDTLKKMPGKVKHIMLLMAVSFPFYIIWEGIMEILEGKDALEWMGQLVSPETLKEFLLYNYSSPVKWHLWFLPALLYCYLLFWVMEKYQLRSLAYWMAPILLACHFFMEEGSVFTGKEFRVMEFRNFFFTGFPFFMLGHLFHRKKEWIRKAIPKTACITMASIGGISTVWEFIQFGKMELYVGSVFLAAGIFLYSSCHEGGWAPDFLAGIGRKHAFSIYLLHLAAGDVWKGISIALGFWGTSIYEWTRPFAACILATAAAAMVYGAAGRLRKIS